MDGHFPHVAPDAAYCDRCGEPRAVGAPTAPDPHAGCRRARALEPPRFCGLCRRRMVVQVTPRGWTARCVEHGELAGEGAAPPG